MCDLGEDTFEMDHTALTDWYEKALVSEQLYRNREEFSPKGVNAHLPFNIALDIEILTLLLNKKNKLSK